MQSEEETIVCGCAALSLADLRQRVATTPQLSFEDLLTESGAGTRCTSCLLDLEYHFVAAQGQRRSVAAPGPKHTGAPAKATSSFKRRLYDWLDHVSPLVPYLFNNSMPVLYGSGIEQWLWITNRSMLFEGKECAPTMRIDLLIRDCAGRIVETVHNEVTGESALRFLLSAPLEKSTLTPPAGSLGIGSVEIRRHGAHAGIRGTTRPQIEILTAASACAVHSQAMAGAGQYWFACLYRPRHERMFFSILNGAGSEAAIDLRYPIGHGNVQPMVHRLVLPAHGAALHEMTFPPDIGTALDEEMITVTWHAAGPHKLHAICATPNLDRFSIDHL
jgi:hypothetical protein